MTQRPNVLFIFSDQHNAKFLGCQGHPHVLTPNLDRLAAGGVRFETAIAQNTICTPSRVCNLSGQYCHNHGYYALLGPRPRGLPTVLGHFRGAGYRTGFVGKSHGPEYWIEDDCDDFHDTTACAIGGRDPEYVAYLAERGVDITADFAPEARDQPSVIDYADSEEGYGARKAIALMRRAAADATPFFTCFWPPKPHGPYTPARPFWDLYDREQLTLPPNADYDLAAAGKSPLMQSVVRWVRDESDDWRRDRWNKMHAYLGNVSQVDAAVGEVLDFLDDSGLADNTIVIYSADHGDYACEHGPNEKVPGICTDAVTHVPMIWRWPKNVSAGHVVREVVESVDIAPTLSALAGLAPLQTADGRDISPMLAGQTGDPDRLGVTEYALSKSVRKGKWRLVYYPRGFFDGIDADIFGELYDLEADPWEMRNLYFDADHTEAVRTLERELMDWLMMTTRPTTIQSPVDLSGPQTVTRHTWPINADGKIPYQQFQNGLPNAPHL